MTCSSPQAVSAGSAQQLIQTIGSNNSIYYKPHHTFPRRNNSRRRSCSQGWRLASFICMRFLVFFRLLGHSTVLHIISDLNEMRSHSKNSSSINLKTDECFRLASEQTHRSRKVSSIQPMMRRPQNHGTSFSQEEMRLIREKCLLRMIMRKMYAMIPLNNPPFKIFEEWEMDDEDNLANSQVDNRSFDEKVFSIHPMFQVLSFIQGLNFLFYLWGLSVSLVFQEDLLGLGAFFIIAIELLNAVIKVRIIRKNVELEEYFLQSKSKEIVNPLFVLLGCTLMMVQEYNGSPKAIAINVLMCLILICVSYNVFEYFQVAKIYAEEKKLIKQLRIVQLFCFLLLLAHIFGLLLYSAIYVKPQGSNRWIDLPNIALANKPLMVKYIYSIYWAMTTTITVGFGDITPQNYAEVIIVMIVQLCGTSFFGYMISVIGGIVDKRNMKNEEYDNYQQTITKLRDHYSLSQQLCEKMKGDIKDKYNKQKSTPLKKIEQTEFLQYVQSNVKKDFIHETNIRIIKKSIFFLTYFTIHFQNQIALKLIRAIYKKQDSIFTKDEDNQRKLIIINNGKINLFIEKKHNNISCKKQVKSIQTIQGKPTLNVYGYSSLILNRDIPIFAQAETITSGYQLKLSDVLEIISKNMVDYQTFHEMRERMLINPIKESIEVPVLKDYSYHYTPNIFILSKKENKKFYQERSKRPRKTKRTKLELIDVVAFMNFKRRLTKLDEDHEERNSNNKIVKGKPKTYTEFESLISIEDEPIGDSFVDEQKPAEKGSLELNIDQIKIFDHFLKWSNINHLASKYEASCKNQSYKKRIQSRRILRR